MNLTFLSNQLTAMKLSVVNSLKSSSIKSDYFDIILTHSLK